MAVARSKRRVATPEDPVTAYARAVVAGERPAATRQIQACERHLRDLARQRTAKFPFYFDAAAAIDRIAFFGFFRHSKGEWAGLPFTLAPFQAFIVGSVYGWKRVADGLRRFKLAYVQTPRKNGKSTLASGLAIQGTFFDGEPGAEGYIFATKRDQALIVFHEAKAMVAATPDLKQRIRALSGSLFIQDLRCSLKPLGADADTLDGLNPHLAVGDELHAHKTRGLVDVIESATGARRQAMVVYITTPGYDRESICFEKYGYATAVLEQAIHDETMFVFIADPDEADDWRDIRAWAKANPGLGLVGQWIWDGATQAQVLARLAKMRVGALEEAAGNTALADRLVAAQIGGSVKFDDLVSKAQKAEASPAAQNTFRRYQLGQWTEQAVRAIDMALWDACKGPKTWQQMREELASRPHLFCGADLASTQDIAGLGWVSEATDAKGVYEIVPDLYIPEERLASRKERERLQAFVATEALTMMTGHVINYDRIRQRINDVSATTRHLVGLGYDPWNAGELARQLRDEDGIEAIEIRQGPPSMGEPTKKFLDLVAEKKIRHGGHPVLRWMAGNLAVRADSNGNLKPDKERSAEKIDGIVAVIIAFALVVRMTPVRKKSPYATRGASVITAEGVRPLLPPREEPAP